MNHNQVTPEQLQAALTAIKDGQQTALADVRMSLRTGFEALNDRLDSTNQYLKELNGRTRKAEEQLTRHDERLRTLFATRRRHNDPDDEDHRGDRGQGTGVTQRDVRLVVLGAGAILSLFGLLRVAWPLLNKAFGGPP